MDRPVNACPAALEALLSRVSVRAKQLVEPAPDDAALARAIAAACRTPDHGALRPWRFLSFRGEARRDLAKIRADALAARDPLATPERIEIEYDKAMRAPLIVVSAARLLYGHKTPVWEQMASAAAATMNLLNGLHLQGFGAVWLSGASCADTRVKTALGFSASDALLGYIMTGTPRDIRPAERPAPETVWRVWGDGAPNWA